MFTETDLNPQDFSRDIVRRIAAGIDRAIFALLGIVYQLFFSVASADIFSTGVISKFYSRVQLIIGVFVLFQLAMTILRGIVNPDGFTDSKSGAGNIVMRICTALVMLALIVPINIPSASNEFEKQINNNGLLFGALYSLQHRILSNNTIGKVVMGVGNNKDDTNYMSGTDNESLKEASDIFTSTILKGFYRINLIPEKDRKTDGDKEADQINYNRVCRSIDQNVIDEYKKINANPGTIIGFINETCSIDPELKSKYNIQTYALGNNLYVFNFMPVVSSIIGLIFAVVLLSFCVDVAMRAIKLAVLRLLAPIPIISYMDPKGGKDGAFGAWTKALTSTYLDLFIRVASVYFVIYMIQQMLVHGITTSSTGTVKSFTVIFIWIGLFYFAKEAPKFIKQVLGIKDDGSGGGIFSGLGKIMGLGAAVGGVVGSGLASARASRMADETRQAFGEKGLFGRDINPNGRLNRAKHLVAGIAGGIGGGVAGGAAAMNAKDHRFRNAMDAMQKRNAGALARGNDGSTLFGRLGSSATQYFTGDGVSAANQRKISSLKGKQSALEAVERRVSSEMGKQNWTYGELVTGSGIEFNYKDFMAKKSATESSGGTSFTIKDKQGNLHTISMEEANYNEGNLKKNNENSYIVQVTDPGNAHTDSILSSYIADAEKKAGTQIRTRKAYKDGIDKAKVDIMEAETKNIIPTANDRYSGKK